MADSVLANTASTYSSGKPATASRGITTWYEELTASNARFWIATRDLLFLAFAAAFALEGLNRIVFLFLDKPSIGDEAIYFVRLLSYLLILSAIVNKNRTRH